MFKDIDKLMDHAGSCDIVNCVNCSRKAPIFRFLSDEELMLMENHRTEVKYHKGELIHKSGAGSSHVLSFNTGLAKLYIEDNKGRTKIIKLLKSSDFFVSPGVFSDNRNHFSIKTITDSKVCLIDVAPFKMIMEKNPSFAFEYINLINTTLLDITEKMYNMVKKHNTGKIADTILYLEKDIYESNPFDLTLTTADLADLSGVGRDTSNRILNDFKSEGIISYNNNILEIKDRARLERISENA